MGMPVEIHIVSEDAGTALEEAFAHLVMVDERFSTYKEESEISRINRGELAPPDARPVRDKDSSSPGRLSVGVSNGASAEMQEVFALADKTKRETDGYFDIRRPDGTIDPSGIVKGWAIKNAAARIRAAGHENYFVNAGGDIAMHGTNEEGKPWSIGIQNPFKSGEIVKVVYPGNKGIATSGSYLRGAHIYNPHAPEDELGDVVSLTVIGPDVLEADRFATAAFAMGKSGIEFVERLPGFEAYVIDARGKASMTTGFAAYTHPD